MLTSNRALPDLDETVDGALAFFRTAELPQLPFVNWKRPLVLGSGNAATAGRILFEDGGARFADESSYARELQRHPERFDCAVLISASGGKDAVPMARLARERGLPLWLITANAHAPARAYADSAHAFVFPKIPEPYTYNVSTYLGMLLAQSGEDAAAIRRFIAERVSGAVPKTLTRFDAFYFILPPPLILLKDMVLTKFDELFGARVSCRAFTFAQTRHAKTLVPSETECFISVGEEQTRFGASEQRVYIPLPAPPYGRAGFAAAMAILYFVIGRIQRQHPPYYKDNIERYVRTASEVFGERISVMIE